MTDHLSKDQRSWNMSRIKSRHTKPELILRSLLHRSGFRFRLNYSSLPGTPDIVLPKYRTVIFVHGCFWHRHQNCSKATTPKTNRDYWQNKFDRNVLRDVEIKKELKKLGWHNLVVWECEVMADPLSVFEIIIKQLDAGSCKKIYKEVDRRQIMRSAEKRSSYYLNGESISYGK